VLDRSQLARRRRAVRRVVLSRRRPLAALLAAAAVVAGLHELRPPPPDVVAVLEEAGTDADHVAKLTIYLDPAVDPAAAYAATGAVWGRRRTAVTVLAVAPARAGALVEIEAVASIPAR
jgi:hypothetical protein